MIKSMTGFASLTRDEHSATISVTIRSVNHRFLDVQLRMPPALAPIESKLRAGVQQKIARGRVEVSIAVQARPRAMPSTSRSTTPSSRPSRPPWIARASAA